MFIALGNYRFSLNTSTYQSKEHTSEYRWSSQNRIGEAPVLQFVGAGEEIIRIEGVIYPHYKGGLEQVDNMRQEARKGVPLRLVQGGSVLGHWAIVLITDTETHFRKDGTPLKVEFSLQLKKT